MSETVASFFSPNSNRSQNYMNFWENTSKQKPPRSHNNGMGLTSTGIHKFRNDVVILHRDPNLCVSMDDGTILFALTKLSLISHENLLRFVGVVLDGPERCVLTDEATRGSLFRFLASKEVDLTLDFKISLLLDVVSGMHYVHRSTLEYHGRLTSKYFFLDAKFTCKIGQYWSNTLRVSRINDTDNVIDTEDILWMAPEVLRGNSISNKSDIYSFGIILQEILLRSKPYAANEPRFEISEIKKLVSACDTSFRPFLPGF